MKRISTTWLAKQADVSQATVSYVLNGCWREKRISEDVAKKIIALAESHNYRPNRLVSCVMQGCTHLIALITPNMRNKYIPDLVIGVDECLRSQKYRMILSNITRGLEEETAEIDALLEYRVDGFLIAPRFGESNLAYYKKLFNEGIRMVFLDGGFGDIPCSAVMPDNINGTRLAVKHLIKLGHRRIGYIAGLRSYTGLERIKGYQQELSASGITDNSDLITGDNFSIENGYNSMAELLKVKNPPTGVCCANDEIGLGAMQCLWDNGLKVPDDISVIGFTDHIYWQDFMRVPMTTIAIDGRSLGATAAQTLVNEISNSQYSASSIIIPGKLIERASAAPPKISQKK